MLRFPPLVFGLTLPLMKRLIFMMALVATQTLAGSWLDLQQRNDPGNISQDMRNLATLVSVPSATFLRNFGQVSFTQSFVNTHSGLIAGNQHIGFAIQPLPEWVFSAQLWNLTAQYPVFGHSLGAKYIWSWNNRVEWGTEVQLNRISGQGTFSQKNLSLTQHFLRINPLWMVGLATTYNLEHTRFTNIQGVGNRDGNYWILSGTMGKTFWNMMQISLNMSAQKSSTAGSLSLQWGVGD